MRVRDKTLLLTSATLVALLGILVLISQFLLQSSVASGELQAMHENVTRAKNLLDYEIAGLDRTTLDWSTWDETSQFVQDHNADYIRSYLADDTYENLKLNLILFFNPAGEVVFAKAYDWNEKKEIPVPSSLNHHLAPEDPLISFAKITSGVTGILTLPEGQYLVSAHPILTGHGTGPSGGTLLMARALDQDQVAFLSALTQFPAMIYRADDPRLDSSIASLAAVQVQDPMLVRDLNDQTMAGYAPLRDIYGNPALILQVDAPRDSYQIGQTARGYLLAALLCVGLLFGIINYGALNRLVLTRLARLGADLRQIGAGGDVTARLVSHGRDELDSVADSVNSMLASLQSAQQQQLETEQRYRALVEQASEGILLVDAKTKQILETNTAYQNMMGYSAEELRQMTLYDIGVHDGADNAKNGAGTPGKNPYFTGERQHRRRDGFLVNLEVTSNLVIYGGQQVLFVIVRDTTERKYAQESLRRKESYYHALIDNLLDPLAILNADGIICYTSPSVEQALGHRADQLVGTSAFDYVHPDDLSRVREMFNALLVEPDRLASLECRLRNPEGAWSILEIAGKNVLENPAVVGIVCNLRDITARRRVEQALRDKVTEARQHLAEFEAVQRISAALRVARTRDEMLPILLDETLAVLGTTAGQIDLLNATHDELRVAISRGWMAQTPAAGPAAEGISELVLQSGQPYVTREFSTVLTESLAVRWNIPPGWGGAIMPIRTADQITGLLRIGVALPRELEPHEVHLLATLAEIAGNALQRVNLHAQTERQVQHLNALRTIDLAINRSLDLQTALEVVLDQVMLQLGSDAADILLLDPVSELLEFAGGRGVPSIDRQRVRCRLGEGYAGRVALERDRLSIVYLNSPEEPAGGEGGSQPLQSDSSILKAEGFISYYGVPLIAKGQVKGVLEILHRTAVNPDAEWLGFLEALAGQAAIAVDNAQLFHDLWRSTIDLMLAYESTIEGWSRALELRDQETQGHTKRVTEMTVDLAHAMGISGSELVQLRRGALLHDIGKLAIPDRILLKSEALTPEEWEIMRSHPARAYEMLSPIQYLHPALDIPYCHHERWNGEGYPRGLKGEAIPVGARIFAVADVWDALSTNRPYRLALGKGEVCAYFQAQSGKLFDPEVVEVLLELVK